MDRNIDDLVILLEPGKWNGQEPGEAPNGENQPTDKPLFGVEP